MAELTTDTVIKIAIGVIVVVIVVISVALAFKNYIIPSFGIASEEEQGGSMEAQGAGTGTTDDSSSAGAKEDEITKASFWGNVKEFFSDVGKKITNLFRKSK